MEDVVEIICLFVVLPLLGILVSIHLLSTVQDIQRLKKISNKLDEIEKDLKEWNS